jgi:5-formyltetrahydrofolate cyclo-ligase
MSDLPVEAERSRALKVALRSRLLTTRRSLSSAERLSSAAHLQDQILASVRRDHPPVIAAYVPVGPEPGGADLPSVLAATGARVILPVLRPDNDLDWAAFTGSLAPGPRGLSEPSGDRLGVDGIRSASLILVPALAVDRVGQRLGRGGGSYDRALDRASRPGAGSPIADLLVTGPLIGGPLVAGPLIGGPQIGGPLIVALLHDGELIESVPAEAHDRPVHGVITPTGGFVRF